MHDEDEDVEEEGFKMSEVDEDMGTMEDINDFGLDEEDPDKDR